jgi:hypothetical protein
MSITGIASKRKEASVLTKRQPKNWNDQDCAKNTDVYIGMMLNI